MQTRHTATTLTVPIALTLALLAGCTRGDQPDAPPVSFSPIIAEVNGEAVTQRDLDAEIERLPAGLRAQGDDPVVRRHLVERLVRERLLAQKARELGLHLDPEFRQRLARIERRLLADAAREWKRASLPEPTEAEIRAWYAAHPDQFTTPEQVRARHLLVASEKQARSLLRQLRRKPDDFAAVAARLSLDDNTKARGGDLNWFPRGVMAPAFEKLAFSLKKGEIGGPVQTRFGWHVIQVLDRRPASLQPLDAVRDEIVSILRQKRWEQWMDELAAKARIRVIGEVPSADDADGEK
ncbi:MAG: peptidylprolyl isomerase [Mariprofundaceae bacterium]